uniref:Reticulon 4 receptor like 2 n=1 Tax=Rousettus aegyptiacus TaxID=9407 RepID=A0A7J8H5J2_ROUAE|nr:reticulon 4 receptor like 2 [Rousettus aegyptiacus]
MLPGLGRLLQGPASACLLLMLLAPPPAAPSCPMLCTCYSAPPTVSCQANNFSSVPLFLPPGTQRLFLQNNLIRTLRPGTFGPNLLTLWLFSNNLSTIYPGTFRHLQALEELDLGDNRHLRSLDPDTFQGLERLQSLHLYRCQLSSLPGNIFRGLVSLQYLYLQENSLLHLQDDLFADLANLSHLFLHGNRLRLLTEHVFRGLGGLDRLLLHGNRATSSCLPGCWLKAAPRGRVWWLSSILPDSGPLTRSHPKAGVGRPGQPLTPSPSAHSGLERSCRLRSIFHQQSLRELGKGAPPRSPAEECAVGPGRPQVLLAPLNPPTLEEYFSPTSTLDAY